MKAYQYIIIGGGMTGSAAAMEIRKNDKNGSIAMFSKENYLPYNRPPLTKSLWEGKNIEDIVRPIQDYYVDLYLSDPIKEIDPEQKTITDENGEKYKFDKLLLATGGHPIHLPNAPEGVIYYRTRSDFHKLVDLANKKDTFCVIGGGFIGSEISAALTKQGKQVTMIFPEVGISGLRFPDDLAKFLNGYYREKGVNVLDGCLVESISKEENRYQVTYKNIEDDRVKNDTFDVIIIGIGIKPNLQLAEQAGLKVDDGIIVNETLQTSHPDIFAAGDVANFLNKGLKKRVRVEHEDNANKMGATAGHNMSAKFKEYDNFPFFYSDMFDLGYEAIGELNKDLDIFEDWIEEFKKGTVAFLDKGKIRGLIFWNLWGQVDNGRKVISEGKTYQASELEGLFS
jgi:3-phenylpropionate/trans-cinnamate dioxygenase ferredoxin reductase component